MKLFDTKLSYLIRQHLTFGTVYSGRDQSKNKYERKNKHKRKTQHIEIGDAIHVKLDASKLKLCTLLYSMMQMLCKDCKSSFSVGCKSIQKYEGVYLNNGRMS